MITLCKRDNFQLILTDLDTNALAAAKQIHYEDPTISAITGRFVGRGVLFQDCSLFNITMGSTTLAPAQKDHSD
jgi:hypothetical protein